MLSLNFKEKRAIFVLFSFFFTACSSTPRQWESSCIKGNLPHYRSSRLCLSPENNFTGLEVDIIRLSCETRIYINSFGLEFKADRQSPEGFPIIEGVMKFGEEEKTFEAYLLKGGHRLLLSEETAHEILELLHQNQTIEIIIDHTSTIIIPDRFSNEYKKLDK